MPDTPLRGRFLWHELNTTDLQSAEAFYSKVVGWSTKSWEQDSSYKMWMAAGRSKGGLMALPEAARAMGAPPHWLCYIGSPNVDVTAREAVEMGGTVLNPAMDLPTVGRFAVIQDPQGAVFAVITPSPGPQPAGAGDDTPGLGDFSWHDLATTDWKAALSFYQKLFGWEKTSAMDMDGGSTYQMFGWGKNTIGGMFTRAKETPGPSHWLPYAVVSDSKRTAETIKKAGGKVINGPMEVPGGDWIAAGIDLQGAVFAVHSKKPAAAAAPKAEAETAKPAPQSKPALKSKPSRKTQKTKKTAARPAKKKAAPKGPKRLKRAKGLKRPKGLKRSAPAKQTKNAKAKKGRKALRRR